VFKKRGKKPHSEAVKKGAKKYKWLRHTIYFIYSHFMFLVFPEVSGQAILSVFRASNLLK